MPTSRTILVMTYASDRQIETVIKDRLSSIKAWCYIRHDKDEAEPHAHILLKLFTSWTPSQIEKWFKGLTDTKGEKINTFAEVANDLQSIVLYLTHEDTDSIEKGKHRYNREEIHDYGISSILPKTNAVDNTLEIVNELILGRSLRYMVQRYGREFVHHWQKYVDLASEIRQDEGYAESKQLSAIQNSADWHNYNQTEKERKKEK